MDSEPKTDIIVQTGLDQDTGAPLIGLLMVNIHDEDEAAEVISGVQWSPEHARTFAINLLMSTFDVEARSAVVMGMRAHKLDEITIMAILNEADKIRQARRMVG